MRITLHENGSQHAVTIELEPAQIQGSRSVFGRV